MGDLAASKLSAADFAIRVRNLYDLLVKKTGDPAAVREFIDFQMLGSWPRPRAVPKTSPKKPLPQGGHFWMRKRMKWDRISAKHREIALKLLPKPPRRKRGRPKGALGDDAYNKRYELYQDWIYERTLNPSLTKEQFAKKRLGITDEDLEGEYSINRRAEVDALLQELKPARMKQLDEGQRRALETIYPLVITYPQYLARKWQEAKQHSQALTKEDFLQEFFGWPRDRKRLPVEADMIREYLEKLDQGEKLLTNSERG